MGNDVREVVRRILGAKYEKVRGIAERGPVTGESLRQMRTSLDLTGRELALILGARPETVSRWEHGAAPLDVWAFVLVGSMVLDQIEGRTTTRGRLAVLRSSDSSGENNVRRALVEAVRPFILERWRQAADKKAWRLLRREIAPRAEQQRSALSEEERAAEDARYADAPSLSAADYREEIEAAEAARFQKLKGLLEGIDRRFAGIPPASVERALQTARKNGAPATAARLAWDARIEEPGKKWRDVRAKVEARYRRAAT